MDNWRRHDSVRAGGQGQGPWQPWAFVGESRAWAFLQLLRSAEGFLGS